MNKKGIILLWLILLGLASSVKAVSPSDFGLKDGDLISAIFSDDPDVYIISGSGYKRLFLSPEIFKFYSHLGGFANVKLITPEIRDSFPTSGLFRNCEDGDQKVYGVEVGGEDNGQIRWINTSGEQAVKDDPDFFKKVFCINHKEFIWYPKATVSFVSVKEVPSYSRKEIVKAIPAVSAQPFASPTPMPATPAIPAQPAELCYNCPSAAPLSPSNVCRTFNYTGDDFYLQDNAFLNLLKDKGVKITGSPSGSAWSTRFSGTAGNTGEVVGFISPDRSETNLGISDNETLIMELTSELAQAVEISLTVTPSAASNNIPATVLVEAFNQMGKIVAGEKRTFTGVTDNKLTPATFTLKAPSTEISKIIIQTSQHPSGGVWLKSIGAVNACTTISTPTSTTTPTPIPIFSPSPTVSTSYSPAPTPTPTPTSTSAGTVTLSIDEQPAQKRVYAAYQSNQEVAVTYEYGTTTSYGSTKKVWWTSSTPQYWTANGAYIGETYLGEYLSLNTTYHVRAKATNKSGTTFYSGDYTFYLQGATPTPTPTPTPTATPASNSAVLSVSSTPSGASVTNINYWGADSGYVYCQSTPCSVQVAVPLNSANLQILSVNIRISKVGYYDWTNLINLYAGQTTNVNAFLLAISTPTPTPTASSTPTPTPTPATSSVSFDNFSKNLASLPRITIIRDLYVGTRGNDVKQLQALLANEVGYSADLITGYFGRITSDAVKRLQEKYGIKPISGYFGELTRKTLRALVSNP